MKYLKDLGKVSFFVLVMYLPAFLILTQSSVERMNEIRSRDYADRIIKTKNNFENLITTGRYTEACIRLAAEYDGKYIESYRFLTPDLECYEPQNFTEFPPITANQKPQVLKMDGKTQTFIRFKHGETDWAYSVLTMPNFSYFDWFKKDQLVRESFFELIILVIYIIFAFVFFSVILAVDSIKNKFRKNGKDPLWLKFFNKTFGHLHLSDMQILKTASHRLVELKNTLELERDVLQRSLEYTILNEIRSNNHKVPYTFVGTVAKVDINGFSKVVAQGASQASFEMATILENIGCELLQRYNGLFEKTVGDEIVVVFRGSESELKATAFVRDLMSSFSQLSFAVGGETRQFTLKGSIASSQITFCKRSAGYGFLGDAFTITSRLLEAVVEKERNVLSVLLSNSQKITALARLPKEKVTFKFKNMNSVEGFFVTDFLDIVETSVEMYSKYFLSDEFLLRQINMIADIASVEEREMLMSNFSNIEIRLAGDELTESLVNAISTISKKPNSPEWNRTLSRLISACVNFVPTLQWKEKYSGVLLSIPLDREGRVNSAILGVLMEKDPLKLNLINTKQFLIPRDPSHRTQGQILIAMSRHSMTDRLISQVIAMISSSNENESATGIYVACDVINYFWKDDLAGFTTLDEAVPLIKLLNEKNAEKRIYISERLQSYLKQTLDLVNEHSSGDLNYTKEIVA
jgi:hypothetical protein